MQIGELATATGVSTKTIRYYEDLGVLPEAERMANGYRRYDQRSVDRLRFVRDAQAAGLSLAEIEWVLELRDGGESTCEHVVYLLENHLADIDRQIEELKRTRQRLEALTGQARRMDPANCTDPVHCQTIPMTS